jgi:hypothetical protein
MVPSEGSRAGGQSDDRAHLRSGLTRGNDAEIIDPAAAILPYDFSSLRWHSGCCLGRPRSNMRLASVQVLPRYGVSFRSFPRVDDTKPMPSMPSFDVRQNGKNILVNSDQLSEV